MGGLSFTGVTAHDNNVRAAEGVRQSAITNSSTQAAANTAEIAYFRSRKSSAAANGLLAEVANAQLALVALGTGGN